MNQNGFETIMQMSMMAASNNWLFVAWVLAILFSVAYRSEAIASRLLFRIGVVIFALGIGGPAMLNICFLISTINQISVLQGFTPFVALGNSFSMFFFSISFLMIVFSMLPLRRKSARTVSVTPHPLDD